MIRLLLPALVLTVACGTPSPDAPPAHEAPAEKAAPAEKTEAVDAPDVSAYRAMFGAVKKMEVSEDEKALVDLGRQLYYDPRLSKNGEISCNSCHMLDKYGVDGEPTSPGFGDARGDRNSPTTYHAFSHIAQFWDGRAADVEAQAKGPILNPVEMAMPDETTVEGVLASIPGYAESFKAVFPESEKAVSYDNMAKAIGAFERKLTTPSRFDAWIEGDDDALKPAEKQGFATFVKTGCATCHTGPAIGGSMYMKIGAVQPYDTKDVGRFAVTNTETDKQVFKVPSLRNITETAPYFHDGSVGSLSQAVSLMAKHQLGKELSEQELNEILTFLSTLKGELPMDYIAKPELPESGPETAKYFPG